jgi:hypothetical protein
MNRAAADPLAANAFVKRPDDRILRYALRHRIGYDSLGKKILVVGRRKSTFPRGNVSDIGQPDLVSARMT